MRRQRRIRGFSPFDSNPATARRDELHSARQPPSPKARRLCIAPTIPPLPAILTSVLVPAGFVLLAPCIEAEAVYSSPRTERLARRRVATEGDPSHSSETPTHGAQANLAIVHSARRTLEPAYPQWWVRTEHE